MKLTTLLTIATLSGVQCPEKLVETCNETRNGVTNIVYTTDGDKEVCKLLIKE